MRKTLSDLPWLVQLLLVIFVDGLFGGLYRLGGKKTSSKVVGAIMLVSFILFFVSVIGLPEFITWIMGIVCGVCEICDIITMILAKKITVFAD